MLFYTMYNYESEVAFSDGVSVSYFWGGYTMSLPLQTGLYHDQRKYTSLSKTKLLPSSTISSYQPRVCPSLQLIFLSYTDCWVYNRYTVVTSLKLLV